MVNKETGNLNAVFHALSDPTRRSILEALASGEKRVSDLAAPYQMSLPAVSKHLKVLEQAGLLSRRVEGRTHHCTLNAAPMHRGYEWIRHYQRFWNQRLDALEAALEADEAGRQRPAPSSTEDLRRKSK